MNPTKGITPRSVTPIQMSFDRQPLLNDDGHLNMALKKNGIAITQLTHISNSKNI